MRQYFYAYFSDIKNRLLIY